MLGNEWEFTFFLQIVMLHVAVNVNIKAGCFNVVNCPV